MKNKFFLWFWRFMAYQLPYRLMYKTAIRYYGYRRGVEKVTFLQSRFFLRVLDYIDLVYGPQVLGWD